MAAGKCRVRGNGGSITRMIGVIANPPDHETAREFFELFKTPWEFYKPGARYDVVLCATGERVDVPARLIIQYDGGAAATNGQTESFRLLTYSGAKLPIYGGSQEFAGQPDALLTFEDSGTTAAYVEHRGKSSAAHVGYDLFSEVRTLLVSGQPVCNASYPALDLHIAFLRDLIVGSGISLVEVPPVPVDHAFIACLTHDVDHPHVKAHGFDRTTIGFIIRAVLESIARVVRRDLSLRGMLGNWVAAVKLPFVHLGIAKDFWRDFPERYFALETGLSSTFFIIPYKDRRGKRREGLAPGYRAADYGASEISDCIRKLSAAGCEIGLHGIDAWLDPESARGEMEEIRRLSGADAIGVRMHWLYYDEQSPAALEEANAAYDSTVGYNQTVGYRAGTTQVFKPLGATRILELPLHVMDTAMFYLSYLALNSRQVRPLLKTFVNTAAERGGCLTVNWHDRSTAPERQWGDCYRELIAELKTSGAWFATASQAVSWFQLRRSVTFETDRCDPTDVRAVAGAQAAGHELPALRLRIYNGRESSGTTIGGSQNYLDLPFDQSIAARIDCAASL